MRIEKTDMIRKIFTIVCLVLAVLMSGCQGHVSSNPAIEMKRSSIEVTKVNEENNSVVTAKTSAKKSPTVTAYYFHRTMRCPTCLAIEANAGRIIEENFPQQIADGRLTWIPYNLDDPDGKEFEKEFDVSASTLVLSKTKSGNHTEYKKLEKVWNFVHDPDAFDTYVRNEVKQFLNE